ncbi:HAMP domain-containing sensor histidine kinase [Mitsuaria sp. GD03876]|uniref:sensor histidine kinase n=1 Tax=Mitsuaria sp. GD03876 TaxID=2975399 RepID=UPI002448D67D|nr:HAMP domain-containing sensor histidine kinase [Mitsuaria sp. GD03876]MDH0865176.1 HAMP domain-containing histidine kinase [Mitsuaria sp. GD03876]
MKTIPQALREKGARIAAAVLVLLVLTFGVLQVQWMAKVGELERDRHLQSLQASLANFAEDFDGELSRLQLQFQMSPAAATREGDDGIAEHFDAWRRQTKFPTLVQEIWVVVAQDDPGAARAAVAPGQRAWIVRRFDPETRRLLPGTLPQRLERLRDEAVASTGMFPVPTTAASEFREPSWLDEASLTITAPLFASGLAVTIPARTGTAAVEAPFQAGFAFVVLRRDQVLKTVLPALAVKHFGRQAAGADDADAYDIAVRRDTDAGEVVFSTFGNLADELHPPDASVPLLRITPLAAGFQPVALGTLARVQDDAVVQAVPGVRADLNLPTAVALVRADAASQPAPPAWRLTALHRSGSLASFVEGNLRRNLAISAAVLLLLLTAASVALLAWQRSSDLRQQQLEFVAGISHELRTPVSVVCLSAANLADGLVVQPSQVRQYGQVMLREGRRLAEMTEQVLAFAKIESNLSPEFRPFPIARVVQSALDAYEVLMRESKCACSVVEETSGLQVLGDAGAVEQALQNLLSNALKYSGDVREIGVSVLAREDGAGSWVGVSVEDRGVGIPASELDQVFLPFRRGHQALERNVPGTGVGLSLVKRVADRHGGRVEIQSVVGQGTVVTLWLPRHVGDAA